MFYLKLAFTNLGKNRKTYFPYLLTCILTIMMFYVMSAIGRNAGLDAMHGSWQLKTILLYAARVTGLFAALFLFYTNSFLVKQRKKEFGLYQVLGMDKMNMAKMLACESGVTACASLMLGLVLGLALGKLMFLVLLKMIHFPVSLAFSVEPEALLGTVVFFLVVFCVTFFWNLLQIRKADPIELLYGSKAGEKEPKTKWLLTLIGIAALGSGYYIALTTESPLSAIEKFFFAVVLVVIGTYALFISGSIAMLKGLKKKKSFYYQTKHFISVSGMIYRMKQNAAGLSSICIMSTVVLVLVSVTVSLYMGMENILETRFPSEMHVVLSGSDEERISQVEQVIAEELQKENVKEKNTLRYQSGGLSAVQADDRMILDAEDDTGISARVSGGVSYSAEQYRALYLIPLSDYNRMEQKQAKLEEGEVLVYIPMGNFDSDTITLQDKTYRVKENLKTLKVEKRDMGYVIRNAYLILPDEQAVLDLLAQYAGNGDGQMSYSVYFDLDGEPAACARAVTAVNERISNIEGGAVEYRDDFRKSCYEMYGGFLFLGVFVGALFLMATILIIYYKQISEGYEDRGRYQIMMQVGMDKKEIKRSIRSQVLMVFFLPLLIAALHLLAAFKTITKLLAVLNLVNVRLEIFCTCGTVFVFAVFYAAVYGLTSREYYKIVK